MAAGTKEQVKELLDQNKSAAEIAEKLGKTKATVYTHIANLRKEAGDTTPRKRGRPPGSGKKAETTGESTPSTPRPRPAPPKAAKSEGSTPVASKASTNGTARFPLIREAIEKELAAARANVTVLEKMLEASA